MQCGVFDRFGTLLVNGGVVLTVTRVSIVGYRTTIVVLDKPFCHDATSYRQYTNNIQSTTGSCTVQVTFGLNRVAKHSTRMIVWVVRGL